MDLLELSLLSSFMDVLYERNHTSIDRESLLQYTEGILNIKAPSNSLLNKLKNYYRTLNDLPETVEEFSEWHLTSCLCGRIHEDNLERAVEACTYIVKRESRLPSCQEVLLYLEYYNQENRFPTPDELIEYLQNLRNMMRNPEEFHQENKIKLPTQNLHLLKPCKNDHEDNCGLCFECISKDDDCYKLPCGHIFHSEDEKCLNETVMKWLSENKTCPICKKEINLV